MIEQTDHRPEAGDVAAATEASTQPSRAGAPTWLTPKRASAGALAVVVAIAAYVAVSLHRRGHTTGDDYALYLRQAQSLFEGNIGQVISDNRLLWANSTGVTPQMYPWGFPVLLAPFVRVFGLDYGPLKLVEVACLCLWLVLFHGIVRRRTDRVVALLVTAVFATAPIYLVHTDQLLTEFPHMMAVAVVIWWLDRVILRHRLTRAPMSDLVVLGLLMMVAYNFRRESIVFLAVIAATQLVDVLGERSHAIDGGLPSPWRRGNNPIGALPWKTLSIPYLSFAVGCAISQFMLPSTLVPDNGNSRRFILERLFDLEDPRACPNPRDLATRPRSCGDYPWHLLQQLGLTERPVYGLIIIGLAFAGAGVACAKAPRLNVPLVALMVTTMLVIGTHFRMVSRYYFQVTPLIVLFVTILLVTAAREIAPLLNSRSKVQAAILVVLAGLVVGVGATVPWDWRFTVGALVALAGIPVVVRHRPSWRNPYMAALALFPVMWLTAIHVWSIPSKVDAAASYNDRGNIQSGPTNPKITDSFEMVLDHTRPDDIVVVRRARTLTLYTDRRALQLTSIEKMTELGDWFLQYKPENYSQPVASAEELLALGYELVDEDANWRLWRIPH